MAPKTWKVLHSKRDTSYRVFSIRTDTAQSPRNGSVYDFYILESNPWVNVIPITPEGNVVLVRQYRHGIRDLTVEIPGGLVDEGDTPEEAAWRELAEETGYSAEEMISLGAVHPNPAIQNNLCYTFLAKQAHKAGKQHQDTAEDIEVLTRPLSEIPKMIKDGEITHSLVIVAFYRYFLEYLPSLAP
ncbi:MAG: NUDIX hydrolase [Deltaproteobacteria bacterium]|nr:MAG: NUDIX hydrolase [Deltaproteobacteria bacterium]